MEVETRKLERERVQKLGKKTFCGGMGSDQQTQKRKGITRDRKAQKGNGEHGNDVEE